MKEISNLEGNILYVNKSDRISLSYQSKGNQIKWRKDNLWIKLDDMGYEGLAEYMSSCILSNSNIERYVTYKLCHIIEDTRYKGVGCVSESFLTNDSKFISIREIFDLLKIDIGYKIATNPTRTSIIYVCKQIKNLTGEIGFEKWLTKLLEFDSFILNEDRHFNNLGVLKTNNEYELMPVFDNGGSLLSDYRDAYPLNIDIRELMTEVKSKPFSLDFYTQIYESTKLYDKQFKCNMINLIEFYNNAKLYYPMIIVNRIMEVYRTQCNRTNFIE